MIWPSSDGQPEETYLEEAWSDAARAAAAKARSLRGKASRFLAREIARQEFVNRTPHKDLNRYAGIFNTSHVLALKRANSTFNKRRQQRAMVRAYDRSSVAGSFIHRMLAK